MSEYFHVEKPFLDQLAMLGWTVVNQGHSFIPSNSLNTRSHQLACRRLADVIRKLDKERADATSSSGEATPLPAARTLAEAIDRFLRNHGEIDQNRHWGY